MSSDRATEPRDRLSYSLFRQQFSEEEISSVVRRLRPGAPPRGGGAVLMGARSWRCKRRRAGESFVGSGAAAAAEELREGGRRRAVARAAEYVAEGSRSSPLAARYEVRDDERGLD